MALKLEDLLGKKKEGGSAILDLAKVKIKTQAEFEQEFEKIPEYKIRPEKVRYEDCRLREGEFSFSFKKKDARRLTKHMFPYADPVPPSMKSVRMDDIAAVEINWRMLTMARPANKLEEDIFSRLIELGKLRLSTQELEARILAASSSGPPGSQSSAKLANMGIVVSKNKRGVMEKRCRSCKECGEELCTGVFCKEYPYESYTRTIMEKEELDRQAQEEANGGRPGASRRLSQKGNKPTTNGKGLKGKVANSKTKSPAKKPLKMKLKRKKKKKVKIKGKKSKGATTSTSSSSDSDD